MLLLTIILKEVFQILDKKTSIKIVEDEVVKWFTVVIPEI